MIKKGDLILIIFILVVTLGTYGWRVYTYGKYGDGQGIVSIEVDGKLYGKYDLKTIKEKTIKLNLPDGEESIVEFKDGMVRIKEANCPDKVCVETGFISRPGDMIVCLPYHIIIKISGESNDVDINAF